MQYIFDDEVRARRSIEHRIMSVFEGWSYSEIILPIFDYADLGVVGDLNEIVPKLADLVRQRRGA